MTTRRTHPLLTAASLAALYLFMRPADAAIFASDLKATPSGPDIVFRYLLNEPAVSGVITIASTAAPDTDLFTISLSGEQLARGAHEVSYTPNLPVPGTYIFKVKATAAPHAGYELITPVTALPGDPQVGYAVKFNTHPGTIGYGHAFLADTGSQLLHEYNAAGQFVQSIPQPESGIFVPVGVALDDYGSVYVTDQNQNFIHRFTPSGDPAAPTWSTPETYTGQIVDEDLNLGSFAGRGLQLFGSGPTASVYFAGYEPAPNVVMKATLGDLQSAPVELFDGAGLAGTRIDQIAVAPDEKAIFAVGSAVGKRHLNKFVFGPNPDSGGVEEWYLDPGFLENHEATAVLANRSRGVAFTPDGQHLWVTQALANGDGTTGNYLAKVSLTPSLPGPAVIARSLRIWGGLLDAAPGDMEADIVPDGAVNWKDLLTGIRLPPASGAVVERVPAPASPSGTGLVVPVTLDVDHKGNIIVVANTSSSANGTVGDAFYVVAPPDSGSSDTAAGPSFLVQ